MTASDNSFSLTAMPMGSPVPPGKANSTSGNGKVSSDATASTVSTLSVAGTIFGPNPPPNLTSSLLGAIGTTAKKLVLTQTAPSYQPSIEVNGHASAAISKVALQMAKGVAQPKGSKDAATTTTASKGTDVNGKGSAWKKSPDMLDVKEAFSAAGNDARSRDPPVTPGNQETSTAIKESGKQDDDNNKALAGGTSGQPDVATKGNRADLAGTSGVDGATGVPAAQDIFGLPVNNSTANEGGAGKGRDEPDKQDVFGPPVDNSAMADRDGVFRAPVKWTGSGTVIGLKPDASKSISMQCKGIGKMDACACGRDLTACGTCGQGWAQRGTQQMEGGTLNKASTGTTGGKMRHILITSEKPGTGGVAQGGASAGCPPAATMPKIHIAEVHILDVSLTKVGNPTRKMEEAKVAPRCIVLLAWIQYDLEYSRLHSLVKPLDMRACLDAAMQHAGVSAKVHAAQTRDTRNEGKGFKTKFDVWLAPSNDILDDEYLVPRFLALNTAVNLVVQNKV